TSSAYLQTCGCWSADRVQTALARMIAARPPRSELGAHDFGLGLATRQGQPRTWDGNIGHMSHVSVSRLGYAHPGGDELFSEVSFKLAPGAHAGLVGVNGVGKSTLLRILAGQLQ